MAIEITPESAFCIGRQVEELTKQLLESTVSLTDDQIRSAKRRAIICLGYQPSAYYRKMMEAGDSLY